MNLCIELSDPQQLRALDPYSYIHLIQRIRHLSVYYMVHASGGLSAFGCFLGHHFYAVAHDNHGPRS